MAVFPRYISGIHSLCPDLKMRQILLGNLIEEEQGEENHPELWLRFAEGLGVSRDMAHAPACLKETHDLVDGYFELVQSDYATGLGALYAYERQTPDVAKSKIDGLKKHYGIHDERSLKFFEVHIHADIWHTEEVASLLSCLNPEEQQKAMKGAEAGARFLWGCVSSDRSETIKGDGGDYLNSSLMPSCKQ